MSREDARRSLAETYRESAGADDSGVLPRWLLWGTITTTLAPVALQLLGVDFGAHSSPLSTTAGLSPSALSDRMHHAMVGSFIHTILEWTACLTAVFTVLLAYAHFVIKRDMTTPVLAVALFWAACMDAFHVLAADRMIAVVADNSVFVPFTWALCRLFNALILLLGTSLFVLRRAPIPPRPRILLAIALGFGVLAYVLIHVSATTAHLPETQYPNAFIKRPYDLLPLALYVVSGIFVLPRFTRLYPSMFASALVISLVPQVVTQLCMVFGSVRLYDGYFNVAHWLKIESYAVPFVGLLLDYISTYRRERRLRATSQALEKNLVTALAREEETNRSLWSEINLAQKIQTVLLPTELDLDGYQVAAMMRPSSEVGGDYYDVVVADGKPWILVGDVSGHGVTAGLIMMMVQTSVRTCLQHAAGSSSLAAGPRASATGVPAPSSPRELLGRVNGATLPNLRKVDPNTYMTMTALCLEGDLVRYAGLHQDMLLFRAGEQDVVRIETSGVWIGVVDDMAPLLTDETFSFREGDVLLLYTDGVTEMKRDGVLFGVSRLADSFARAAAVSSDPASILEALGALVSVGPLADDVTFVVIRRSLETSEKSIESRS